MRGQYNGYAKNDNNITVSQSIPFTVFGSQGKLNQSRQASSLLKKDVTENELIFEVKQTYYQLAYVYNMRLLLSQEDSIYEGFYKAASIRYKSGETNLLEQTTAEVQRNDAKNRLRQNASDILTLRTHLKSLLYREDLPDIEDKVLPEIMVASALDSALISANPSLAYARQQIAVAEQEKKFQAAKSSPDLLLGYFNQTLIGTVNPETGSVAGSSDRFTGFQVGLSIPLWFVPHRARVRAAAFEQKVAESSFFSEKAMLSGEFEKAIQSFQTSKSNLEYYRASALPNADLILRQSQIGFKDGDIGYAEFLLGLKSATSIQQVYLQSLYDYNQNIIYLEYLAGNK
jgi:cobalt-zinc-cadmium resistance protein CzcA